MKRFKASFLPVVLLLFILMTTGCKKDQLTINEEKEYAQINHVPSNAYDGGWRLTLRPDGAADVLPGGDMVYSGTYKIAGSRIKVKTEQNSGSYTFEIISETEIKEIASGTLLRLQ
ncbi:MAG: hypothetical protein EOP45_14195 [Sphingobacteriaceae bacterium]|nr:MAG: hypothetical protein EOP45_14195 [Sphingobacteriaceae bacterium]